MTVYVVTWDLNREKPNYNSARAKFIEHIDKFDHIKDLGLDSVRFISTSWSHSEVNDYLRQRLDNNDKLFLTQVNKDQNNGWLSQMVWDWINART